GDDPMAALKHDPTSALAALPADRRKALLAAPLAGLIVSADEPLVPGSGPVSLASGIVAGPPLAGTRMVTADADGCVHVVVHAATGGDAPVSLDRERTINPASGLVLDQRETQIIGAGNDARIVREQVTIDPPVS
ncbi:hypothetical protein, partial [Sphingomonas bacterium]|uniref:hypothetical protein n=1 Tax=Sphingomonas bacterium TaxID=1895847 RepID=UPI001577164A